MVRYWDGHQWTEHVQPSETRPMYGAPPVRPAGLQPAAGPTTPDGVPLAGWWQRVAAFLIDSVVLSIASSIITLPLQLGAERRMQDVLDRYQQQLNGSAATTDFGTFLGDYLDALGPILRWSLVVSFLLVFAFPSLTVAQIRALPSMHPQRADVITGGALIAARIAARIPVAELIISESDILDGIALELMAR